MNKSTKLILTAGLLALAACSGKGGAGTSFDDSELWPSKQQNSGNGGQQLGNMAPCNVTVKAGNSTLHFCGEIETSYCTQGGGSVVSACDPDYAQTCAVGGYTSMRTRARFHVLKSKVATTNGRVSKRPPLRVQLRAQIRVHRNSLRSPALVLASATFVA